MNIEQRCWSLEQLRKTSRLGLGLFLIKRDKMIGSCWNMQHWLMWLKWSQLLNKGETRGATTSVAEMDDVVRLVGHEVTFWLRYIYLFIVAVKLLVTEAESKDSSKQQHGKSRFDAFGSIFSNKKEKESWRLQAKIDFFVLYMFVSIIVTLHVTQYLLPSSLLHGAFQYLLDSLTCLSPCPAAPSDGSKPRMATKES